jgi:UDP-glucose 4-epimerase
MVFGANGYIGRHMVHFLARTGARVRAFDIHEQSIIQGEEYEKIDITDGLKLHRLDWNADFVFMFAGFTGPYRGFDHYQEFMRVNEIGLLNILTAIRNSNYRPRLIFPSSRLVYKGSDLPLKENDEKYPKTIYAINKLACEHFLEVFHNAFGINYTVYRIGVPYGNVVGADPSQGTMGFFLNQARNDSRIRLYGDGSLRRTFTHIEDLYRQIITSCGDERSLNEIYNILGEDLSLKEVATIVADACNAAISFTDWPEKDLRIESGHTVFNSWKLQHAFDVALKRTVKDWGHTLGSADSS